MSEQKEPIRTPAGLPISTAHESSRITLPPELKPTKDLIETDVPVVDEPYLPNINPERLQAIGRTLGLAMIDTAQLIALRDLGIAVEGAGVVNLARGQAFATSSAILATIARLQKKMDAPDLSIEDLRAIAYPLGYLADKLAKTNKTAADIGQAITGGQSPAERKQTSFPVGSTVGVQVVVKT